MEKSGNHRSYEKGHRITKIDETIKSKGHYQYQKIFSSRKKTRKASRDKINSQPCIQIDTKPALKKPTHHSSVSLTPKKTE